MILLTGVDSLLESIYLKDGLTEVSSNADIIVNPKSTMYVNKLIWVNRPEVSLDILDELSKYNTIKSRIKLDREIDYKFIPYRTDRIKNIKLKFGEISEKTVTRDNIDDIIIYGDSVEFITNPPRNFELVSTDSRVTVFELYMLIISNLINYELQGDHTLQME